MNAPTRHIAKVTLDEASIARRGADVEHERRVAIFDLEEENQFLPSGDGLAPPFHLHLSIVENRLVFELRDTADKALRHFVLSLTPFRKIVKDYFDICESYHKAIKVASPSQIESIDMGRRGLHNEGSEILRERFAGKIEMDLDTARRLFTLIAALHLTG
ncbi:MAG: UPF0262 family protein [Alphaproteobacteria bacterium]|nr:UPF0262 family protein [Alphaproteobacteria bacterium]